MILTGADLQQALNATQQTIRLLPFDGGQRDLLADEIPLLIADGRYQFVGRKSRVRYARQMVPGEIKIKNYLPWVECIRTCQSATLWPWVQDA